MSNYNSERGSVKLPVSEYNRVKKSLISLYNAKLEQTYNKALNLYEEIKLAKKGKRNYNMTPHFRHLEENYFSDLIMESILDGRHCNFITPTTGKITKPKKKDFKKLKSNIEMINYDELFIKFDNKLKTIYYETYTNNHAVERAAKTFIGRKFFNLLDSVKWTNRTGGYFKVASEYYEDEFGNGGQSRLSRTYGKFNSAKHRKQLLGW